MAGDEALCRVAVCMISPALREQTLFLCLQHRKPPSFVEIEFEADIEC
jgi:hypothetical protein